MIGSSVALSISDIPFLGPTGSVSVGMVDGNFIINPNSNQREKSKLDLVVSGTKDAIMMVEAGLELTEDEMLNAIMFAHEYIKDIVRFQEKIVQEVGKPKKAYEIFLPGLDLEKKVRAFATERISVAVQAKEKQIREENINKVTEEIM